MAKAMSEAITVTGMVLFAAPVGDYDKRVVILTRERGKITAFARGVRKSTSPLLAVANPFVFGSFQLYEGKNAYTLVQANIREYFAELAAKQPGVYYGFYFLEIAEYYGREGNPEMQMLNLLYVTMKALLSEKIPDSLIRPIFELKSMVINGEYPQVFECVCCGAKEELTGISLSRGGVICNRCSTQVADRRKISNAALYTIQYIITTPIEKLYTFVVSDQVCEEVACLVRRYIERYTDRKFKSLEVLELMGNLPKM